MAPLKQKGDLAELLVAADLRRRGYRVAFPFGEDAPYDLVLDRADGSPLERVQVKHARSDGRVIPVRGRAISVTNGKARAVTKYTAATIDWIATYDPTSDRILYLPAAELGDGVGVLHIRLVPSRNGQVARTRWWEDYTEI